MTDVAERQCCGFKKNLPGRSHQVCQGTKHSVGNLEAGGGQGPASTGRRPKAAAAAARATCTAAPDGTEPCTVSRHQQRLGPRGIAAHPLKHASNRGGGWTSTGDNISVDVGCARTPRSMFETGDKKNINFAFFFS